MKPLAVDLYCGLGGWTDGLLSEGWRVVGFDIERHDYGTGAYPGQLVIQDVLTLHGSQFKDASLIVASPPCQEFSYMAMPWSRAKAIRREYLEGKRDVKKLTALFDACFRIQREACDAAGRHIPLIVENVRGAQEWVGRSRWNFGSFHLWGDVPALMPSEKIFKSCGMNWSDQTKRGQDFTRIAGQQAEGLKLAGNNSPRRWEDRQIKRLADATKVPSESGRRTDVGNGTQFTSRDCGIEGRKAPGGTQWFNDGPRTPDSLASSGSKSKTRKAASAAIAKIPLPLSQWIARVFKPKDLTSSTACPGSGL